MHDTQRILWVVSELCKGALTLTSMSHTPGKDIYIYRRKNSYLTKYTRFPSVKIIQNYITKKKKKWGACTHTHTHTIHLLVQNSDLVSVLTDSGLNFLTGGMILIVGKRCWSLWEVKSVGKYTCSGGGTGKYPLLLRQNCFWWGQCNWKEKERSI